MKVGNDKNESVWSRWESTLASADPWEPPACRTVVVAPHPDDETLSCGGLIHFQRDRGIDVVIAAVTAGDAAYDPLGDPVLAERRQAEQHEALRRLGVDAESVVALGVRDGLVAEHEASVRRLLADVVDAGDLLVVPWPHDHHPDHEASGRAATAVAARIPGVTVAYWLFWAWHHAIPADLQDRSIVRLDLTDGGVEAKHAALACHASQFTAPDTAEPILDHHLAEPARWSAEYYLMSALAPAPDPWTVAP